MINLLLRQGIRLKLCLLKINNMNYEKKYKEIVGEIRKAYLYAQTDSTKAVLKEIFPELAKSEEEKVRKALIDFFGKGAKYGGQTNGVYDKDILAWLEKQGEKHQNPYNGISFEYNGHIWGMCARDNGVDISCDKHLIKHLEKQGKQKPAWSEEDEKFFKTALWHISYSISNGKSTDIHCDTTEWLKSLKERIGGKI